MYENEDIILGKLRKNREQLDNITNYTSIKNLNSISIENLNIKSSLVFTGIENKISTLLPNVTLSDVQSLDINATLSDSVDWYVVMMMVKKANDLNIGSIILPNGIGIISRTIDTTKRLYRCNIIGKNTTIKPSTTLFVGDSIIKISPVDAVSTNWGSGRMIRLDGLVLDGLCTNGIYGVYIKTGQEWLITNCTIYNCFVGVALENTYYGEMSLENVIQDCVRSVEFKLGGADEINTIKLNNVKMNCGVTLEQRKKLSPPLLNETDDAYKLRVPTVGVRIRTIVGGIEFNGCTIEGQEIGFLADGRTILEDGSLGANGMQNGIFNIDNCYLEAIKRKFYHICAETSGGMSCFYNLSISNGRHSGTTTLPEPSVFGLCRLSVKNCQPISAILKQTLARTTIQYNDSFIFTSGNIDARDDDSQHIYDSSVIQSGANNKKYNQFGNDNSYPTSDNMYSSVQDELYIQMPSPITPGNSKVSKVMSITPESIKFIPSPYQKCGPIIKGDDDNLYMLQVDYNGALITKKIVNKAVIDPKPNTFTAKELWLKRSTFTNRERRLCIDVPGEMEFITIGTDELFISHRGDVNFESANKYPKILPYATYLRIKDSLNVSYNQAVYLIDIDLRVENGSGWFIDWWGNSYNTLYCIGTKAQRPTTIPSNVIGYKFIATDENKIYEWKNGVYSEFIPMNITK